MNIEQLYKIYNDSFLIDTDTRKIRKNSLFFALKGPNFNGNEFAKTALEKGAAYSIVDEKKYQTNTNIIYVDNVLKTLQKLANYHRKQLSIPIIALTGSNGKTTTKELIYTVLKQKFKTRATLGNLNNHIGVPLTLLSIKKEDEIAIVEMGANHLKEIEFLCTIANPDFGYITNFGKAHLEGFGGVEGVIKGKSELYNYLLQHHKTAFVNAKDAIQLEKTANINRILFKKDIQFLDANPFVRINYQKTQIQTKLLGAYNFNNIAAAITIGAYFGVEQTAIKNAIENYTPTNNRSQVIKTAKNTIILDAYNANPTSMQVALESFKNLDAEKKILVLGDMFELGADSLKEHQNIVNTVEKLGFKQAIFVGNHFAKATTEKLQFITFEEVKQYFVKNTTEQYTILIKGSRGMALERLLEVIN